MKRPESKKPRKQRKWLHEAPHHVKSKMTSSNLSPELRKKYGRRVIPLRKGDSVVVERGDFKGTKGEVIRVEPSRQKAYIDGLTVKKSDGTDVEKPVHSSNLMITDLFLDDKERREVLERKIPQSK